MNILVQGVFFLLAGLILVSGTMVVVTRNIIHSALWLIASFVGVGALYFLLEAPFIGVVQILVYAGAVSILVLFAIMLTRQVTGERTRQLYRRWWLALLAAIGIFAAVLVPTILRPGLPSVAGAEGEQVGWPRVDLAAGLQGADGATTTGIVGALEIGQSFMREYLLQFEVASVLLLAALIGAVVIAYEERAARRRVLTLAEEVAMRRAATDTDDEVAVDTEPPVEEEVETAAQTY